jgi:hypothetical protein
VYTLEIPFHSRQSAVKTLHQFLDSCASRNIPEFSQKNFDVRRTNELLNKTLPSRVHAKNLEENPTTTGVWIFVMRRRRSLHAYCEESGIVGTIMRVEKMTKSCITNRRGLSQREMRWMLASMAPPLLLRLSPSSPSSLLLLHLLPLEIFMASAVLSKICFPLSHEIFLNVLDFRL